MKITVRKLTDSEAHSSQGFTRTSIFNPDINGNNKLSLEHVTLKKGAEGVPHAHVDTHSVVYTLQGTAKIYFGDQLESVVEAGKEESVYIPPNVTHHVVNEHEEEMIAIVARTPYDHVVKEFPELVKES